MIIPAKPPVSFFSSRSPVLDLFQGQLDYAEHIRRDSEVVLLFFYAPWCGQSIAARAEIEQAASRLSDQEGNKNLMNATFMLGKRDV